MQSLIMGKKLDINTVCLISSIGAQLSPTQPGVMKNKTAKDPILSKLKRYILEGFSPKPDNDDPELRHFRNSNIHLQLTMDALSMDQELSFLRHFESKFLIFYI